MLERIEQFRQSFKLRKAEENDTRQDIQRHDPDYHKKKKESDEGGFKDPYEDLTDVSIPALIAFLEGLIDKKQSMQQSQTETAPSPTTQSQDVRPPVDRQHAQAMNAYQARANTQADKHTPRPTDNEPQTMLDKATSQLEQSDVNHTIRALDALLARGVTHIAIERSDSFLQSIQNAIAKY